MAVQDVSLGLVFAIRMQAIHFVVHPQSENQDDICEFFLGKPAERCAPRAIAGMCAEHLDSTTTSQTRTAYFANFIVGGQNLFHHRARRRQGFEPTDLDIRASVEDQCISACISHTFCPAFQSRRYLSPVCSALLGSVPPR